MEDQAFELDVDSDEPAPLAVKALLAGVVGLVAGIALYVNEREATVVTRKVAGGPGPSGIEMPGSGCWTFDLRWAGQSDRLRLAYRSADPG